MHSALAMGIYIYIPGWKCAGDCARRVLPACKVPANYTLTLRGVTLAISPDYAVSRINSRAGANNT